MIESYKSGGAELRDFKNPKKDSKLELLAYGQEKDKKGKKRERMERREREREEKSQRREKGEAGRDRKKEERRRALKERGEVKEKKKRRQAKEKTILPTKIYSKMVDVQGKIVDLLASQIHFTTILVRSFGSMCLTPFG